MKAHLLFHNVCQIFHSKYINIYHSHAHVHQRTLEIILNYFFAPDFVKKNVDSETSVYYSYILNGAGLCVSPRRHKNIWCPFRIGVKVHDWGAYVCETISAYSWEEDSTKPSQAAVDASFSFLF